MNRKYIFSASEEKRIVINFVVRVQTNQLDKNTKYYHCYKIIKTKFNIIRLVARFDRMKSRDMNKKSCALKLLTTNEKMTTLKIWHLRPIELLLLKFALSMFGGVKMLFSGYKHLISDDKKHILMPILVARCLLCAIANKTAYCFLSVWRSLFAIMIKWSLVHDGTTNF